MRVKVATGEPSFKIFKIGKMRKIKATLTRIFHSSFLLCFENCKKVIMCTQFAVTFFRTAQRCARRLVGPKNTHLLSARSENSDRALPFLPGAYSVITGRGACKPRTENKS